MLPASLAAWVPVFIATATSAWARAGASLVPSPVMATRRPPAWYSPDQVQLVLGGGLGQEIVHPRLGGDGGGGSGLSPVIIMVLMPIGRKLREALLDAALDDVLEVDDAEHLVRSGHHQRRAPQ